MLDKATIEQTLPRRLAALPEGHALDLRSYKRDRSVVFVRRADGLFDLIERGFHHERHSGVPLAEMKKWIRRLAKREFPRSTKLRLYNLGPFDEAAWQAASRKRI